MEQFQSRSIEKRIRTMRGDKNPLDPRESAEPSKPAAQESMNAEPMTADYEIFEPPICPQCGSAQKPERRLVLADERLEIFDYCRHEWHRSESGEMPKASNGGEAEQ